VCVCVCLCGCVCVLYDVYVCFWAKVTHVRKEKEQSFYRQFTSALTPSLLQTVKNSGLKEARTRQQTVYFPVLYHLLSMLCVLMNVLSHISAKTKTEMLKGLKFRIFIGHFQATSWQ